MASPFESCYHQRKAPEVDFLNASANKVDLAVSELGGLPGYMAYHTSVVINGEEFFFSPMGVRRLRGLESHNRCGDEAPELDAIDGGHVKAGPTKVIEMGSTSKSGDAVLRTLSPYFELGTYDLVRKNCNAFTDVALFYLLGIRLDKVYNSIEKLGANNPGLLRQFTRGAYAPNPKAVEFDIDKVLRQLEAAAEASAGPHRMALGTVARIKDLLSDGAKHLNGKVGVVQRFNAENGRYEVKVLSDMKALKPENLEAFQLHQEMVIGGLQSEGGAALNGQRCKIERYNAQTARLEVKPTTDGETKALKVDNLQLA